MNLGEKIKLERQRKKISQQQLADAAGIHQKNISKYESDAVVPSAVVLKHIADCLEASTDYLLGDGEQTIKDTALLDQFKQIDSLNEQD